MLLFALLGSALVRERGPLPPAEPTTTSLSARAAVVVAWVYVLAFGSPVILNAAHLLQNGRLPSFLGLFTMYGAPWLGIFEGRLFVVPLAGFLMVTLAAAWAAWLVWRGSRLGGLLTLSLLPLEATWFRTGIQSQFGGNSVTSPLRAMPGAPGPASQNCTRSAWRLQRWTEGGR